MHIFRPPLSRREPAFLVALLVVTAAARLPAVYGQGISTDEAITLLETAGHALPPWPKKPTPSGVSREIFRGTPGFGEIARELRGTDVHPPLYFWILTLWRRVFGYSIETARLLSLLCSLGTMFVFYHLLRAESSELSGVGTMAYALAPGLILSGTSARPYPLAMFLLSAAALFAYRSSRASGPGSVRGISNSVGMAVCCGLAVHTNYLALFSVAAILSWYLASVWRRRKLDAMLFPALALSIAMIVVPTLSAQMGQRPDQETGFSGLGPEIKTLAKMTLMMTFLPDFSKDPVSYGTTVIFAALAALTVYELWRSRRTADRGFWLLLSAIAAAPALGIMLLNPLFNKFLQAPRYLTLAGPAIVAFVSYPAAVGVSRGKFWGAFLLVAFLLFLTTRAFLNHAGQSNVRATARAIRDSAGASQILILDEGWGRGGTGSIIYELAPVTSVVVLQRGMSAEVLMSQIQGYDDVLLSVSFNPVTASIREGLQGRLAGSDEYHALSWDPRTQNGGTWSGPILHFRRVEPKERRVR